MLCPNCQQDSLLQGKEKQVCINCGYSQSLDAGSARSKTPRQSLPKVISPKRAEFEVPEQIKASTRHGMAEPNEVVRPEKALVPGAKTLPVTSEPEPETLPKQVRGGKNFGASEREIKQMEETVRGFGDAYSDELKELLRGSLGRQMKIFGIVLASILVCLWLFTFFS